MAAVAREIGVIVVHCWWGSRREIGVAAIIFGVIAYSRLRVHSASIQRRLSRWVVFVFPAGLVQMIVPLGRCRSDQFQKVLSRW
jgi:hypothetical protein